MPGFGCFVPQPVVESSQQFAALRFHWSDRGDLSPDSYFFLTSDGTIPVDTANWKAGRVSPKYPSAFSTADRLLTITYLPDHNAFLRAGKPASVPVPIKGRKDRPHNELVTPPASSPAEVKMVAWQDFEQAVDVLKLEDIVRQCDRRSAELV